MGLLFAGIGLTRVVATDAQPSKKQEIATPVHIKQDVLYQLDLSASAASIELSTDGNFQPVPLHGAIQLDPANPHVAVRVKWKNAAAPEERRFVKLTLEIPGSDVVTHYFDRNGDIDDLLELPIDSVK